MSRVSSASRRLLLPGGSVPPDDLMKQKHPWLTKGFSSGRKLDKNTLDNALTVEDTITTDRYVIGFNPNNTVKLSDISANLGIAPGRLAVLEEQFDGLENLTNSGSVSIYDGTNLVTQSDLAGRPVAGKVTPGQAMRGDIEYSMGAGQSCGVIAVFSHNAQAENRRIIGSNNTFRVRYTSGNIQFLLGGNTITWSPTVTQLTQPTSCFAFWGNLGDQQQKIYADGAVQQNASFTSTIVATSRTLDFPQNSGSLSDVWVCEILYWAGVVVTDAQIMNAIADTNAFWYP